MLLTNPLTTASLALTSLHSRSSVVPSGCRLQKFKTINNHATRTSLPWHHQPPLKPTTTITTYLPPLRNVVEDVLEKELYNDGKLILPPSKKKSPLRHVLDPTSKTLIDVPEQPSPPPPAAAMKLFDAVSIIAGTAIGGGFLALPSVTSPIGYAPTIVGVLSVWTFLLLSSTAIIESFGLIATADRRRRRRSSSSSLDDDDDGSNTSIATIIRAAFGHRAAVAGSLLFVAQMFAVVTAQVVKGAQLLASYSGGRMPYLAAVWIPACLVGYVAFRSEPLVVERANSVLTVAMMGGFVALMVSSLGVIVGGGGGGGGVVGEVFRRAEWGRLLPKVTTNGGGAWAIPVFVNLLCFGQAMPLVVERMVPSSSPAPEDDDDDDSQNSTSQNSSSSLMDSLRRARSASLIGATVPLLLTVIWAAISTALVAPTTSTTDPLSFLLFQSPPTIALPVLLLSIGAIGTTLLGSFLAMGHFAGDLICTAFGYCSLRWMTVARVATVGVPCALACLGEGSYLPLLAFSGAYPTTILYGLAPGAAGLVLRWREERERGEEEEGEGERSPRVVPGGDATLMGLVLASVGLVGASTVLAVASVVRKWGWGLGAKVLAPI